jgi:hypothetical protein
MTRRVDGFHLNYTIAWGRLIAALQWKLVSAQEIVCDSEATVAGYIAVCLGLAEDISKEIRTISHLLHPPLLDEAGLSPALHSYIEGMRERSGLTVFLEIDSDLVRLSQDLEMAVSGRPDEHPSPRPNKRGFRSHSSRVGIVAGRNRRSRPENCGLHLS